MSNIQNFAKETGALCVGATAFALGDPSGGTLLATPLAALAALGLTLNAGCAAKAETKAQAAILKQLGDARAFKPEHIDRARLILKEAPATAQLDPKAVAHTVHGGDLEDTLTTALLKQLAIGEDDPIVRRIIETALRAGIAACKADETFRSALSLELILETAREISLVLDGVTRIEETTAKNLEVSQSNAASLEALAKSHGTLAQALDDARNLHQRDLQVLAQHYRMPDWNSAGNAALTDFLRSKASELDGLRSRVVELEGKDTRFHNHLAGAREALRTGDIPAARARIREAREAIKALDLLPVLLRDAEFAELEAEAALADMNPQEAFEILSAAADSFARIDSLEPARRRILKYFKILFDHGLRYGGIGLQSALDLLESAVTDQTRKQDAWLWAAGKNAQAVALQNQGTRTGGAEGAALLAQAVTAYRAAQEVTTRQDHPVDWATTQNNLGSALRNQGIRTGGAEGADLLAQTVTAYRAALEVRTRQNHPVDWAMTQNNLGAALRNQGTRTGGAEGAALLAQAVTAYRAALEVYTRQDHPVDWAMTQNNLAIALRNQGIRTGGAEGAALLAQAVIAYRAALEVRTRQDEPVRWAMTQNNLGTALSAQGTRTGGAEGAALLAQAVIAYRAALEVYTRLDHPVDWAMTQNNAAIALQEQGIRTGGAEGAAFLAQAVTAYRAALEVTTRQDHPVDWAETQMNLAFAEKARAAHDSCTNPPAALQAALDHVDAALTVFDPDHMPYHHTKATTLSDEILAALNTP